MPPHSQSRPACVGCNYASRAGGRKIASLLRLTDDSVLAAHLSELVTHDKRLEPLWVRVGAVSVRYAEPGFKGLAKIVCGQQLSVASATAIWNRFERLEGATSPETYLRLAEPDVRATGMSASKHRTLSALASAILTGGIDLAALETMSPSEAMIALTAHKGIGPWTAELYLLFCTGNPDIFPLGDLALQKAVAHGLGLGERVPPAQLQPITEAWAPWRGAAALLFWAYFAHLRDREGVLL